MESKPAWARWRKNIFRAQTLWQWVFAEFHVIFGVTKATFTKVVPSISFWSWSGPCSSSVPKVRQPWSPSRPNLLAVSCVDSKLAYIPTPAWLLEELALWPFVSLSFKNFDLEPEETYAFMWPAAVSTSLQGWFTRRQLSEIKSLDD